MNIFSKKAKINYFKLGNLSFKVGVFLLASAPFISILFILIASLVGAFEKTENYFKDKWNIPLFISGIFMVMSCIYTTYYNKNLYNDYWDYSLSWIGLLNWIPFFWFFWALQPFLISKDDRQNFAKILISGSIPVLISCLLHYFLNWTGPYSTFNGLIIWFQKPILTNEGVTGLFNNPNYTGAYINIIWPFLLASILNKKLNKYSKIFIFILIISSSIIVFLTLSRNAWLGYFLTCSLTTLTLLNFSVFKNYIILFSFPTAIFIYCLNNFNFSFFNLFFGKISREISPSNYQNIDMTRLEIWIFAIKNIFQRPIFGWGAASFPVLLEMNYKAWKGHAHNLFLEIGVSYGLPFLLLILIFIILIMYKSLKIIFREYSFKNRLNTNNLFENAWYFSLIVLIISQMFDVQYFDGRISFIFWILLAGMKNKITNKKNSKINF